MGTMARFKAFDSEVVNATAAVESAVYDVSNSTGDFAVGMVGTGDTCTIKLEYACSQDGTNYDTTTTSPSRTILASQGTSYLVTKFHPPVCKYLKIVATGIGSNSTDATITGHVMFDEG